MSKKTITDRDIIAAKARYKEMNRKEKMSYVWEYYKVHIIIGCILLVFLVYTINISFINPPKKNAVSISFLDTTVDLTMLNKMLPVMNDALVEDQKKYAVQTNTYFLQTNDIQLSSLLQQKIMAQFSVKELDIFISAANTFVPYSENGMFLDLETLNDQYLSNFEPEYAENKEDGVIRMYGLRLKDCDFLNTIGVKGSDFVLSVAANSTHVDMLVPFLEFLYN